MTIAAAETEADMFPNRLDLCHRRFGLAQALTQELGYGWQLGEMEKEESRIDRLGHGSFFLKSIESKLLKAVPALRRDLINRAFAAARDLLRRFWCDIARFDQLPHSIIKGADVEVGVALDQSAIEPPFNFVGVKVAAVKGAEDIKFGFHIIIKLLQSN